MNVDTKIIYRMIQDNDHNKYTTLYYLLEKKQERGELSFSELHKERPLSPKNSKEHQISTYSRNSKKSNSRKSHSRRPSRRSREEYMSSASRDSKGSKDSTLPTIRPQLTVNDITVEVREKITFNTSRVRNTPTNSYPYNKKTYTTTNKDKTSISRMKNRPSSRVGVKM